MLDIKVYLKEREKYGFPARPYDDEWIDKIKSFGPQYETFFVTTDDYWGYDAIRSLSENYRIAGVFELGAPFIGEESNFVLVHLTAEEPESVRLGIYRGKVVNGDDQTPEKTRRRMKMPDEYDPGFERYIKWLEQWINTGRKPEPERSTPNVCEFNTVKAGDLEPARLDPEYYTQKAVTVRELMAKENFIRLGDVADVLVAFPLDAEKEDSGEPVKVLLPRDFVYPLDINSLSEGKPTDVILQQGDIVLSGYYTDDSPDIYLYNDESGIPVRAAPPAEMVIRCRNILPEYLFFYLNSDIPRILFNMIHPVVNREHVVTSVDLKELPVTKPLFEKEKYIRDFALLSSPAGKNYENHTQSEETRAYRKKLDDITHDLSRADHIEDIINMETAQMIKAHEEQQLRLFLADDLRELNTCFAHGAYKSVLILAGSILEAVLIDWLSERDGKNYFEKEYPLPGSKKGKTKRDDLLTYINEIRDWQPDWEEAADKAHAIRERRNLVHARLSMKKSDEIDELTCRKTVSDLQDVLKTRGVDVPEFD